MLRKSLVGYATVPILAFAGYFACLLYFPWFTRRILHTEHGLIEWGTAVAFLVAALTGSVLLVRSRGQVPAWCRVFYGLFVAAAVFVALEEASYGQKLFHWETPSWFAANNSKRETNLHNMFDNKPSNRMRSIATIGCPLFCIVLPVIAHLRGRFERGRWQYFLLPRYELVVLAALTLVLTIFNKIPEIRQLASWTGHLGEAKELLWGIVAVFYARILSQRFEVQATSEPVSHVPLPTTQPMRRAA